MKTIKIKKVGSFLNVNLYQATDGSLTLPFQVENLGNDKIGNLKRVECSKGGMFESYTMKEIKSKIYKLF